MHFLHFSPQASLLIAFGKSTEQNGHLAWPEHGYSSAPMQYWKMCQILDGDTRHKKKIVIPLPIHKQHFLSQLIKLITIFKNNMIYSKTTHLDRFVSLLRETKITNEKNYSIFLISVILFTAGGQAMIHSQLSNSKTN